MFVSLPNVIFKKSFNVKTCSHLHSSSLASSANFNLPFCCHYQFQSKQQRLLSFQLVGKADLSALNKRAFLLIVSPLYALQNVKSS